MVKLKLKIVKNGTGFAIALPKALIDTGVVDVTAGEVEVDVSQKPGNGGIRIVSRNVENFRDYDNNVLSLGEN